MFRVNPLDIIARSLAALFPRVGSAQEGRQAAAVGANVGVKAIHTRTPRALARSLASAAPVFPRRR